MRRIAMMSVGVLVAGCGATGQKAEPAAAHGAGDISGTATRREKAAVAANTLPVLSAGVELAADAQRSGITQINAATLAGEDWLSGPRNDYNLSMDAAGALMVFARSDADFKASRIWFARREGQGWSLPVEVPFADARYKDSDPWLTPDGRTLYFVSNRPLGGDAPNASLDIWRVTVETRGFGTLEHLPALASDGEELGPELHDGWLYFNSSRKGGPAKLSIYRARAGGSGFDAPVALPAPFNDGDIQGDLTLSPDGRVAVFWSRREGSDELDLFAACRRPTAWSRAVRLPASINGTGMDFTPAFSSDGRALYFASLRADVDADDSHTDDGGGGGGGGGGQGKKNPTNVMNGQSNLFAAPAALMHAALREGACGA